MTETLIAAVTAEIEELHAEFARWYGGATDDFSRIENAIAADFMFIAPHGEVVAVSDLLAGIRADHGRRPLAIRIENVQVRWHSADATVATYEEWQEADGVTTARLSSVLFTPDASAPHGLAWRHVHETWLVPPPAPIHQT